MPPGDVLSPAVEGAELQAAALDEKRHSIALANEPRTSIARNSSEAAHMEHFPTAEEMATLRRVANNLPLKLLTIAFVELCERFSFYGCTAVCK